MIHTTNDLRELTQQSKKLVPFGLFGSIMSGFVKQAFIKTSFWLASFEKP